MNNKVTLISRIWLVILFIAVKTMSQVLFKHIALGPGGSSYFALPYEPMFYMAGILFFGQAVVWLLVLRRFPLSVAYPFTSVTFITIIACGAIFFGEPITLGNVLGTLLIMIGVTVIAKGNHAAQEERLPNP